MKRKQNQKQEPFFPETNYFDIWLSNHEQYLTLLDLIRKDTQKIVIVQIDGQNDDDPVVNTAKSMMTIEKREIVHEWFSTIAEPSRRAVQYTFLKNRDFFDYLSTFESFFIGRESLKHGYEVIDTDFGLDDIAFLDENGEILFSTTTHEGFATLHKRYADAWKE